MEPMLMQSQYAVGDGMILYNASAQKSNSITNIPVYTKQLCP